MWYAEVSLPSAYTAEGTKGLLKDGGSKRRAAVEEMTKALGGKSRRSTMRSASLMCSLADRMDLGPSTQLGALSYKNDPWRCNIAKVVRCREVGVDCDFEARGETEQEVLDKCAEHGRTAHGMQKLPQELVEKVRAAIREEAEGQAAGA